VAFGSRIPLSLSTIQINTNLLGDYKPHSNRSFFKEGEHVKSIGQSTQFQCDIPPTTSKRIQVEKRNEGKVEKRNEMKAKHYVLF